MSEHGIPDDDPGWNVIEKYELGIVLEPVCEEDGKRFMHMLVIPYLTPKGYKAVRFRRLDGQKPKFGQPKHQSGRLYNTWAYFADKQVIGLAEGEIDSIVATEFLNIPTMGIPGVAMWTANEAIWKPLFKNFEQVIVFTDGDPPQRRIRANGEEEWYRPGEELGDAIGASLKTKAKIVTCPENEDISSMVAKGRESELLRQFTERDEE